MNYYNEIDDYAAQWLLNLINAGHIPPGVVDTRSIEDVRPDDLSGFIQCHFFAGIGIWPLALRRARWPDNRPIWTASCPCQPYSQAGEALGFADERHLWPAFYHLAGECRPGKIVGEQVASQFAESWIDLVQTDMETLGYAFGAVAFPAASVGAPNIRDRVYWVADSNNTGLEGRHVSSVQCPPEQSTWARGVAVRGRDGNQRIIEPGIFPLANGDSTRVGRVRAYGNALNAEQARIWIEIACAKSTRSA